MAKKVFVSSRTNLCWCSARRHVTVPQLPLVVAPLKAQTPRVELGLDRHHGHVCPSDVDARGCALLLLLEKVERTRASPRAPHKPCAGRNEMDEIVCELLSDKNYASHIVDDTMLSTKSDIKWCVAMQHGHVKEMRTVPVAIRWLTCIGKWERRMRYKCCVDEIQCVGASLRECVNMLIRERIECE